MNKTSVFVSVSGCTQKAFLLSLDQPSKYLTDVSVPNRALRFGRLSRHGDRRDFRRARLKFKIQNLIGSSVSSQNDETAKRRNDETAKLVPNG